MRPYAEADLGDRIRVLWSGAEYRGRGRNTTWRGRAQLDKAKIDRFEMINQWNPERLFEQRGSNSVLWDTVTTGNFMGFDVWLDGSREGRLDITTNLGDLSMDLADVGLADTVLDAGGLARQLRCLRLPGERLKRDINLTRTIDVKDGGDNPIWICVTTEDGYQAWSSPIYLFR